MKLNETIIEEIGKKLQTGCPAKYAAMSEGIAERTFYTWKSEGEELLKRITDKDGEIIAKEFKKLTDTEKLKTKFTKSIGGSVAMGHVVLAAARCIARSRPTGEQQSQPYQASRKNGPNKITCMWMVR